ncbi:MAG: hypothetical protein PHU93_03895 [Candidatus Gracilibacteria bacterium]|nr:hypothetical protein [Candidatus Gracilibacteria bacterium]
MAGNTPTLATENQGIREIPKSSALSKTVAGIALASTLALSGGTEAATSPEIVSLSEEYKACVASAAETTKKFRAVLEKKQSEGADTSGLEVRMKKIVDDTQESCAKIASTEAQLAKNKEKIASTEAQLAKNKEKIASTEAQLAKNKEKIAELDKINKGGLEINMELQMLDKIIEDFSQQKMTREQFQAKTSHVPQLVERIRAHIIHVKQVIQDPKIISIYDGYENNLAKILQYMATVNSSKTAKK